MKKPSSTWQIEFFTDSNNSPITDFLNTLTVEERVKIRNQLRLLREFGIQLGMPQARPLKGYKPGASMTWGRGEQLGKMRQIVHLPKLIVNEADD